MMKMNRLYAAAGIVLMAGLMSSCDPNSQYAVTAKVNGQPWQSTGGVNAIKGTYTLLINAYNDTQPAIVLSFTDFETPGTFALDSIDNSAAYSNYSVRPAHPGTFTITSYSSTEKNVAGTFSFKGFSTTNDSIVVTEGAFDVNFQ